MDDYSIIIIKKRCNDYPAREYTQASGNGRQLQKELVI